MRPLGRFVALAAVAAALAAGCSDAGPDRAGRFCAGVRKDQAAITSGVQGSTDVGQVVARFRALEATAPLAIEEDWGRLTELVELAADLDPTDAEARSRLVNASYEADRSVRNVLTWVRGTCGVDLAVPVTTPPPTTAAPATTIRAG